MATKTETLKILKILEDARRRYSEARDAIANAIADFIVSTRDVVKTFIELLSVLKEVDVARTMTVYHVSRDYRVSAERVYVAKIRYDNVYRVYLDDNMHYVVLEIREAGMPSIPATCARRRKGLLTIGVLDHLMLRSEKSALRFYVKNLLGDDLSICCDVAQYIMLYYFLEENAETIRSALIAAVESKLQALESLISRRRERKSRVDVLAEELSW